MALPEELTQEQQRLQKLQAMMEAGRNPFDIHKYPRTHTAAEAVAAYQEPAGPTVSVCGRLMTRRGHGKTTFADLFDASGKIQVYARRDDMGEESYRQFQDLDLGDILGVTGPLFVTRSGEVTVKVEEWQLLSKALRPLPEKWHGLQDVETRYRQRYLDLLMNPEVRALFEKRSRIITAARTLLCERGFHEVETPVLQPLYGGAKARPFITHHNALDMQLYMRIAPELYLKRLVVGGMERVFEIGKMFRNEGVDTRHNPEFTMMEVYQAYADYEDMMELTESLICAMAQAANGCLQCTYGEHEIDLTPPWRRVGLIDSIRGATGVDFAALKTDAEARAACAGLEFAVNPEDTLAELMDRAFDHYVQPTLIQPTFVMDYPVAISPLAKRKPGSADITARFEAFIGAEECGNAFSELNDPLEQRQRFEEQVRERQKGDHEAHPFDEDYVRALEYGLPPTGGLGIGIDRVTMLLCNRQSIREVVLFPLMRSSEAP